MSHPIATTLLTLAVSIVTSSDASAPAAPRTDSNTAERAVTSDAARRSLDEALERAQNNLERKLELYQDRSTWERAWVGRSAHYEVRSTLNRYFAKRTAEELEASLDLFRETLLTDWRPPTPQQVYVFPDLDQYSQYGDANGAEHSSFYGSYYASTTPERAVATYQYNQRNLLRMWITHSAFHQFVDQAFERDLPLWVEEGLASYFAIRPYYNWAVAELNRVRQRRGAIPFVQLLSNTPANYADRPDDRLLELGMLFIYLFDFHPESRTQRRGSEIWLAPLSEYLNALLTSDDFQYHPLHRLLSNDGMAAVEMDYRAFAFPR